MRKSMWTVLGAVVALTVAPQAQADDTAQLRAELDAMKAELAQLKNEQGETWLNERRAEEVKALVNETLSDAQTRATLLQDGVMAGHDGKKFFLESADGSFRLNIGGQIQFRYIFNRTRGDQANQREENQGFQLRRMKVKFDGHIGDPKIKFKISLAGSRGGFDRAQNGGIYVEQAEMSYDISDWLTVYGGRTKGPFLREELVSSSRQLAVERSWVNEQFTWGWTEGVGVKIQPMDNLKLAAMVNDGRGRGEGFTTPTIDYTDSISVFAIVTRAEYLVMGDWKQFRDFNGWTNEEMGLLIGAGFGYQNGDWLNQRYRDPNAGIPVTTTEVNSFTWTADASFKVGGWTTFVAIMGAHQAANDTGSDYYGLVAQLGYNIDDTWEPFGRVEYFHADPNVSVTDQDVYLATVGVNWFLKKNAAKFTADAIYVFNDLPGGSSGLGLLSTDTGDQIVFRLQFQLLF